MATGLPISSPASGSRRRPLPPRSQPRSVRQPCRQLHRHYTAADVTGSWLELGDTLWSAQLIVARGPTSSWRRWLAAVVVWGGAASCHRGRAAPPIGATCRRDPRCRAIHDDGQHPPGTEGNGLLGRGAALGGDVVAAPLAFDLVDFTKDKDRFGFILLARVSPGERVHDNKSMAGAGCPPMATRRRGFTWNVTAPRLSWLQRSAETSRVGLDLRQGSVAAILVVWGQLK